MTIDDLGDFVARNLVALHNESRHFFFTVHMQKGIITLGNFTIDRIAQPKSKTDFRTQICTFLELKKLSLSCIYYSIKTASNSYPAVSMTWYDKFFIACICID